MSEDRKGCVECDGTQYTRIRKTNCQYCPICGGCVRCEIGGWRSWRRGLKWGISAFANLAGKVGIAGRGRISEDVVLGCERVALDPNRRWLRPQEWIVSDVMVG